MQTVVIASKDVRARDISHMAHAMQARTTSHSWVSVRLSVGFMSPAASAPAPKPPIMTPYPTGPALKMSRATSGSSANVEVLAKPNRVPRTMVDLMSEDMAVKRRPSKTAAINASRGRDEVWTFTCCATKL